MHQKHKGSLAELQACAWLLKEGYEVFRNVSQHGVADLIAWRPDGLPILVEVRTATLRVAVDGKSCSVATARLPRHTEVRFLYVFTKTGDCGFDLEALVSAMGYTLRPARAALRLVCSVEGCDRKHSARGFCKMHYDRWKFGLVDGQSLTPQLKVV
jgi:Holliday junction resolvase-like predicted endonuclease